MRRLLVLGLVAFTACSSPPARVASTRVVATPVPTPSPTVAASTPAPVPPRAAVAAAAPAPAPVPPPPPAPPPRTLAALEGLGGWIDVFDHTDDPNSILPLVRGMASQGVRTLYLETARFASETDIQYPRAVGAALDEAKSRSLRVVAWYPPAFDDLDRDVRRSLAAVRFTSPGGNRFDAFGADIEYGDRVPDAEQRTAAAIEYSRRLREGASDVTLAAIVIAPSSLELNPDRWPNFPWLELGPLYDAFMPMNYWTARSPDPDTAAQLTEHNTAETKRLTGKPVHVIGGLAEDADEAQVSAYVAAARRSGSLGGGLYDYRTTRPEVWDELRTLNG